MNVSDITEEDSAIRVGCVKTAVFIPTAFELVSAGVKEWSSVENVDEASLVLDCAVADADGTQHFFITFVPRSKDSIAWLATAPD